MRVILAKGLEATASQWPDVRVAFGWVHRAAAVLRNKTGVDGAGVRRRYRGLIGAIARHRRAAGRLAEAFAHFLKVTRSYWPGLFHCYEVEGRRDGEAEVIRGYCAAVRSALTDDGRPPLEASGLKLQRRLEEVAGSLDRVAAKRGSRGS